jgi:hypothetical protein
MNGIVTKKPMMARTAITSDTRKTGMVGALRFM